MIAVAIFIIALLACLVLSGAYRWYALRRGVLDQPNERSLHRTAVPRGAGAAIAVTTLAVQSILVVTTHLPANMGLVLLLCGALMALVGWLDDLKPRSSVLRLLLQIPLAGMLVWASGITSYLASTIEIRGDLPLIGALCTIGVLWMVNLFNFMDGSDGFAATEGLVAASFGAYLALVAGAGGIGMLAAAIAGACGGFLYWNWQPARMFMGDSGSYFLGFQFAALMLVSADTKLGIGVWVILLAPFITDSSCTLIRRVMRGERWWQAHRAHVYQLLIQHGWRHAAVAKALAAFTVLLLWPLAYVSFTYRSLYWSAVATAFALTCIMWMVLDSRFRPGLRQTED